MRGKRVLVTGAASGIGRAAAARFRAAGARVAMLDVAGALREGGWRTRMLLQVHDELLFEVPEEELEAVTPVVVEKMEGAMELHVPLKVETGVGANWYEAK